MAAVTTQAGGKGKNAGLWASNKFGSVGIVAQDHMAPYICLYGEKMGFPALAIFVGNDGKAKLQLPGPDGTQKGVRQIDLESLIEMIGVAASDEIKDLPAYEEIAAMFPADNKTATE